MSKAFIHHVRKAVIVEAFADSGYRNLTVQDVRGMHRPITLEGRDYTKEASGLVISEVRASLVLEGAAVDKPTSTKRNIAHIGPNISGRVYGSTVMQSLPIGRPENPKLPE